MITLSTLLFIIQQLATTSGRTTIELESSTTPPIALDTETRQHELRQELGLRNLVFSQILNIIGLYWVGVAAKLGPAHVPFWGLATLFFYLPSAAVVIYLNRVHTLEGGLYEWSRLGFNEFVGFLTGWNCWLFYVLVLAEAGFQGTAMLSYALGPQSAWMMESKAVLFGSTLLILAGALVIALIGLSLGKWFFELGGLIMLAVFVALIALPFRNHLIGRPMQHPPFTLALPAVSLLSLNLISKMGFGAMAGFDGMAVFAGECRNATRTIGRSVIIATPIIVLMLMLGTSAVVSLVPADKIDLISPISQALTMGTDLTDLGARLITLVIFALLFSFLASQVLCFGVTTRLPLAAGWDRLLPAWFGKLHPQRKTPTHSILFVGAVALALVVVSVAGAGQQEGFQLLLNSSGIFYALAYLVMFALPIFGKQKQILKAPLWLKVASVSGFLMTALYVTLAAFPIIDVPRPWLFTAKVGGFVLACEALAAALFYSYRRKSRATAAAASR